MGFRHETRRGITLIELMVIIAIVALLLAMLMPAIMKLRQLAEQQEDREQMRVLGHAWLAYARAHQGRTVNQKTSDPFDKWIHKLTNYGDIENVLVSPGDPMKRERLQYIEQNPGRYCSSFVLNPYFSSTIVNAATGKQQSCDRLSNCTSLSTAIAILPVSQQAGVPGPGYIFPQGWMVPPLSQSWERTIGRLGIQPDRFAASSSDTSPGLSNYFFADGHVESITAEQIRQWIGANKNFLIPQQ